MDLPHTQQWHHKHNKYPKKTKMFLFAWWVKKSLTWETTDDALNLFYWELRMFILDVVYHCIGPWNFSLSLSRTMSRYTSLQCSINTILADHKSLPYLLLTTLWFITMKDQHSTEIQWQTYYSHHQFSW